ncbi:MAG: FG-GAP repeat protein [Dokdonella sp.]
MKRLLSRITCLVAVALPIVFSGNVSALVLGPVGNVGLFNPNQISPAGDGFGSAMASGDFNADGIDDLAIADRENPQFVRIHFGTPWNIGQPVASPFLVQTVSVPMIPGATLGPSIALGSGDFTKDASNDDELVVGVPGDSFSANHAGAVFVLDRRPDASWVVALTIRQGMGGFAGISEADDNFGASLAVGRFDSNSRVDLAIGIPGETTNGQADSGVVYVVYQGVAGLMNTNEEVFFRGANGLTGSAIANEQLGYALAAGDFNGDDIDDLAVGIPGNGCAGQANAGSVMVLRGRNDLNGLDAAGVSYWSQTTAGILDDCEASDRFGTALAAGDFTGTRIGEIFTEDLAVGIPGEALSGVTFAGAVAILSGSDSGITATDNVLIDESQMPGGTLSPAAFGARLASGRITAAAGSGDSLVIASPLASQSGLSLAGRAWVIPSQFDGLSMSRAHMLSLSPVYALGPSASSDGYGSQLAIGDFNGDNNGDLAIGVPGYDTPAANSGAVQVMYQSKFLFVHGFDN